MKDDFLLGVLIGALSSLLPDVVTSMQVWQEQPAYRPHVAAVYVGFVVLIIVVMKRSS